MNLIRPSRRHLLRAGVAGLATLSLGGCKILDSLGDPSDPTRAIVGKADRLTMAAQRLLQGRDALAPEYTRADIVQQMRPNGSTDPQTGAYLKLKPGGFADYQLKVGGLVASPGSFSLADLKGMPQRSQITRHDCVEGWSVIAEWTGPQLSTVIEKVRPKAEARYAVFHCYDSMGNTLSGPQYYYESLDMIAAMHPQTLLAHSLNGALLPVENGAPLRLRVATQLGYKSAKYLRAIDFVESFADLDGGKGGYWEDLGYDWYAGS